MELETIRASLQNMEAVRSALLDDVDSDDESDFSSNASDLDSSDDDDDDADDHALPELIPRVEEVTLEDEDQDHPVAENEDNEHQLSLRLTRLMYHMTLLLLHHQSQPFCKTLISKQKGTFLPCTKTKKLTGPCKTNSGTP